MDREAVTERVQPWRLPRVVPRLDPGAAEQPDEGVVDGVLVQRRAVHVCQERGRAPLRKGPICPDLGVASQPIRQLGADGNEAALVELRIAYRQHGLRQVDIIDRERSGLAAPQGRSVEKQEQRSQGLPVQLNRVGLAFLDSAEQAAQLVAGVDVGWPRFGRLRLVVGQRRGTGVAAADRIAVEARQRAVLVLPVSGQRTVAGEEGEDLRTGDRIAVDFSVNPLGEEKQSVRAALELRAVGALPVYVSTDGFLQVHVRPSRSKPATSRRAFRSNLA